MRIEVSKLGGRSYKWVCPGQAGVPDRIVIAQGRIWFVELKTMGGKLHPIQEYQHHILKRLGAEVRVIWNEDELRRFLDEIRKGESTE